MSTPDTGATIGGLESGRRVFNRFVLARRLGAGGMGEVWLARDESLGVEVCLKFVPEYVRWSPAALAAHKAEALRARSLAHPNVVRVHDFAEDGPLAAIVMEYVEGRTLAAARLEQPGGVFEPAAILEWLPQLADALDYLHGHACVAHGDLKPANVLLRRDGAVKLADFGVAREFAGGPPRPASSTGGTIPYLSPERLLGAPPSPPADIYALGATLYELLTGRPPFFEGDLPSQVELLVPEPMHERRRRLSVAHADEVPEIWETTVQACLAKEPAGRPATAGAVVAQLKLAKVARRRRRRTLLFAAVLGAVGTVAGIWAWESGSESHSPRPAGTRIVQEFVEDFGSGIAGWYRWGEPPPRLLREYQGRSWVFDNNGDGIAFSGATSTAVLAAPQGLDMSVEVRLDVANPTGCHLLAHFGLTLDPSKWPSTLGTTGDVGDGISIGCSYTGHCWATLPENWEHAVVGASYVDESGKLVDAFAANTPVEMYVDDWLGRWVKLRIVIDADRHVKFYGDGRLLAAPPERVHPHLLEGQRVVVSGRSSGSAGKAFHDDVVVRSLGDGGLQIATAPMSSAPRTERIVWGDANWFRQASGAAPLSWPEDGSDLLFTADEGGVVALRTTRLLTDLASVEFDVAPLLNSGGTQPDVLTLLLEQRVSGGWMRWAAELRGSEIWLVERAPDGGETTVGRIGTYAPGAWATLVFTRFADGRVELGGSRLEPKDFARPSTSDGEWALGIEISGSADGATVRPPRATRTTR